MVYFECRINQGGHHENRKLGRVDETEGEGMDEGGDHRDELSLRCEVLGLADTRARNEI